MSQYHIRAALCLIAGVATDENKREIMSNRVAVAQWHEDWRYDISNEEQLKEGAIDILYEALGGDA